MATFEDEFREMHVRALRRNSAKVMADTLARAREITGTASSPDGSITVVVDSTGMLTSLDLGTSRHTNATLVAQVTAASQKAAARARAEVRNLYATLIDGGVIEELPDWLPEPPQVMPHLFRHPSRKTSRPSQGCPRTPGSRCQGDRRTRWRPVRDLLRNLTLSTTTEIYGHLLRHVALDAVKAIETALKEAEAT